MRRHLSRVCGLRSLQQLYNSLRRAICLGLRKSCLSNVFLSIILLLFKTIIQAILFIACQLPDHLLKVCMSIWMLSVDDLTLLGIICEEYRGIISLYLFTLDLLLLLRLHTEMITHISSLCVCHCLRNNSSNFSVCRK